MPSIFVEFGLILALAWAAAAIVVALRVKLPPIPPRAADAVFYVAAAGYCVTLATLAILRHDSLHSHGFDLGIFDQILWNSSRGHVMEASLIWDKATFLGNHISPTLLLFVPVYWLVSDPHVLLIGQAIALTAGAFPIYWYARRQSSSRTLSLVLGLSYFAYPATMYVNLFDFHEFALAVPFMSFAIYFLLNKRFVPFAVFAVLLLATKEDLGILVSMLGLRTVLIDRDWRFGAPLAVGGVVWTSLAVSTLIPANNPSGVYPFQALYSYLGANQLDILANLVTHPIHTLQILLEQPKIEYLLRLVTPLGLLPLAGITLWPVALPTLAYLLLSADPGRYSITTQYSAPLVPLFFFATVEGCRRLTRLGSHAPGVTGVAAIVIVCAVGSYVLHGPGLFTRNFDAAQFQLTDHGRIGQQLMKEIPADAAVIAQTDLVPQLSDRRVIYMWPWVGDLSKIDYILLDQKGNKYPLDYPDEDYFRSVEEIQANPNFAVDREEDGYLLLRRIEPHTPARQVGANFGGLIRLVAVDWPSTMRPGAPTNITLYWEAIQKPPLDYTAFVHLFDADEQKVAQTDAYPTGKLFSTSHWGEGSRLRGSYQLALPANAAPGEYALEIGLYDLPTMTRLPILDEQGATIDTRVRIEGVRIAP